MTLAFRVSPVSVLVNSAVAIFRVIVCRERNYGKPLYRYEVRDVIEQAIKWGLTTWFRQTGDEQSFTSTQL
jgi:hypothetical protein